jgi:hypothetical protein
LQVAQKRKSVEPSSPVEKKVKPATKVSKKNSTPKPKNIKKTAKQMKSPVKTPVKSFFDLTYCCYQLTDSNTENYRSV